VGEARRPGSYSISSLSTLTNAIFASGGPLPQGSLRDIQVKRNGVTIDHFDLYDLLLHGDKTHDIALVSGDVIFIPFVGPQVAVVGSVDEPAIYELKGETTVCQSVQFAGGETAVAAGSSVRLERVFEHAMRSLEDVSTDRCNVDLLQQRRYRLRHLCDRPLPRRGHAARQRRQSRPLRLASGHAHQRPDPE
jgi:polysaccharide export outer membrane protein